MLNSVSFLSNVKFNPLKASKMASNPISFKGNLDKDTVDFSSKNEKNTQNQDETSLEISRVKSQLSTDKEKLNSLNAQAPSIQENYDIYLQKRAALVAQAKSQGEQGDEDGLKQTKSQIDKLDKTVRGKAPLGLSRKINALNKKIAQQEAYLEMLQTNPNAAFLFNPELSLDEKTELAPQRKLFNLAQLSTNTQLPKNVLATFFVASKFNYFTEPTEGYSFIDMNDENNKEFIDSVIEKAKTSKTSTEVAADYELSAKNMKKLLASDSLSIVGFEDRVSDKEGTYLIDLSNKDNIKALKRAQRTTLNPSKATKALTTKGAKIPAIYLERMGFSSVDRIKELIRSGKIQGVIETVDTPEGKKTRTSIVSTGSFLEMTDMLRYTLGYNKETQKIDSFAKDLKITQRRVKEAIENDEVSIIPQYILESDKDVIRIDKRTKKTKQFIENIELEHALLAETRKQEIQSRAQKRDEINSLRLRLAWRYCDKTKAIASMLAKDNGYVVKLLIKEDNDEELTPKEKAVVNSYRKQVWSLAGTDEFKQARRQAKEIIDTYLKSGVEAVSDPIAIELLNEYENGSEN